MAWSTRQLAELAGTTVKTVRHYHKLGLLEEPERGTNGYKHYGVAHLTSLLRIRRLTELGVPLAQIAEMGDAAPYPEETLRLLDLELAAGIERLQRARQELALILENASPTDLPAAWASAGEMSATDRALLVVQSRLLSPAGIETWRRFVTEYRPDESVGEFDRLDAEADEVTRRELAERLRAHFDEVRLKYPELRDARESAPGGAREVARTIGLAMEDLYNPAQLDVLEMVRAGRGR
ncbi:MerR family transcriptional regulator [Kribbella sp. NPDC056861]|uniref:MerR family transcriptional regulator n=1 Tax=Kribbella sp. NPDC056861 TaxID=3154857 RepID=UPI003421A7C1